MKAIRISNEAYNFLNQIAKSEKRSLIATLDLLIEIFKEGQDVQIEMEEKSLPFTDKAKGKNKIKTLARSTKKSI